MYAIIDGTKVDSRAALHETLCAQLEFPDWYGRNLDALYDCLTERFEDTEIYLRNMEALHRALGGYAEAFWTVLAEAAEENPHITMIYEDDEISVE